MKKLLLSAAAVLTLVAAPAFAQSAGSTVSGGGGKDSETTVITKNITEVSNRTNNESTYAPVSLGFSLANNSQHNGNVHLVADQDLRQSISNESDLNFGGKKADYASGSNSVNGGAFAAYSGILNQGWNTGINSNSAAATNIAANGSTSFTTK